MSAGGILSGEEIREAFVRKEIEIDPFEPNNLNPASIDLRLGPSVLYMGANQGNIDVKKAQMISRDYEAKEIGSTGILLWPYNLYLMHTVERVCTHRYVPVLDGKSSLGRLGVSVHETAGYGDPGFNGQYTLEVRVFRPTRVYAGMRFCQMRFHTLVGSCDDYARHGNYVGGAAQGPVISLVHRQFQEKKK